MRIKKNILLTTCAIFVVSAVFAEIKMPRIFSDNMMFQRGEPVNVWGSADAGATVDVDFNGKKISAKAGADGKWILRLPSMDANANPQVMTVFENGKQAQKINNILIGEVWVAGGQSNMAYGLGSMKDSKSVISQADGVNVRYFAQPQNNTQSSPQFDTAADSHWFAVNSKNAGGTSAVAYTFAQKLAQKLKVPVGIVQTAVSGTHMFSWIPIEEFNKNPAFADAKKTFDEKLKKWDYTKEIANWNELVRTYPERVEKAKKEGKEPPPKWTISETLKPWKDSPYGFRTPAYLYNGRVAPIANFTARGIVWYQGENDNLKKGFKKQFEGFIGIWRKVWHKQNMPFVFVQLPSWTCQNWENMRFDQFRVCLEGKNVAMAVSIDTGVEKDVHPSDKLPFIDRLANLALHDVYGFKDACGYGPLFKDAQFAGNAAKVNFYTLGRKLQFKGEPRGFEVLAGDKWVAATARLEGNSVVVKSANAKDKKISGVRYLWKGWAKPDVCLYNDADIPAPSFTTEKLD